MKVFWTFLLLFSSTLVRAAETEVVRLHADHLSCEMCAEKFRKELTPVCKKLLIDVSKREITCEYQAPVTTQSILAHAKQTGMEATIINAK